MAKLRPGLLRHEVTIKKLSANSTTLDSMGRDSTTLTTHATVKASINKLSGTERQLAHQEFGMGTHEMLCWYVPGVTNTMYVDGLNGKRYNIIDVDNVEEKDSQLKLLLNSETS